MCSYAALLNTLGRAPESLELVDEAAETGRRVLSDDDWRLGFILGTRGRTLQVFGRYDEAAEAMLEGHDILNSSLGGKHEHTWRLVGRLADLYEEWHAAEPGAGHDVSASIWREKLEPGGG